MRWRENSFLHPYPHRAFYSSDSVVAVTVRYGTFDAADAVVRQVELAEGDERVEPLDARDQVAAQLQQLEPPQTLQMLDVLRARTHGLTYVHNIRAQTGH